MTMKLLRHLRRGRPTIPGGPSTDDSRCDVCGRKLRWCNCGY